MAPLANSSSTSFWIMGWWAAEPFMLNCLKSWNNRWGCLSWRWWLFTILSTNLLEVLFHWSQEFRKGTNLHITWTWWRLWHIRNDIPAVPFLHRVSGTGWCTIWWLPATLMTIRYKIKVRLHQQGDTTSIWHRLFPNIKLECDHCLGSSIPQRGAGLWQS